MPLPIWRGHRHVEARTAGVEVDATIDDMTAPAVHRTADPPIPVLVDDNGGTWPGLVLGWRGERVYVNYFSGVGLQHLTWVPAGQVRRRGNDEDAPSPARGG